LGSSLAVLPLLGIYIKSCPADLILVSINQIYVRVNPTWVSSLYRFSLKRLIPQKSESNTKYRIDYELQLLFETFSTFEYLFNGVEGKTHV